ncbi:DUF4870 domain-containing protein [Pleionea mediterranea]|uniref:Uncharacterized protein DUF4870 n=1 Tax=Pleionea mediterranea TaxID=523701 RepID=A0A316FZF0_9GAMM|nr:DUF4870 domain-containing protein [Pleionea mediterranea]PWK53939.1 uncharacterized protein DUF4870 [Pleionea mediterranea]
MDPNQSNQNEPQSNHQSGADDTHATPAGSSSELSYDDKQMAMFCHFLAFAGIIVPFGAIIGPLVLWLVFIIVAGIKANEGEYYRYPFSLRLID